MLFEERKRLEDKNNELTVTVDKLVKQLAPGIHKQYFLRSLIGLHTSTGCDTVSAFAWKGKWKALKLLLKNKSYVTAMIELGDHGNFQMKGLMELSDLYVTCMERNTWMLTSFVMSFMMLKVVKSSQRPCHCVGHN